MEYRKIKKAAEKDPGIEFVIANYNGQPNRRWASKAVLLDTKKHEPINYFGSKLSPSELIVQKSSAEATGKNFGLLVQLTPLQGQGTYQTVVPARWVKGFYADYEQLWAEQNTLETQIHDLEQEISRVKREQELLHQTKVSSQIVAITEFVTKYGHWTGEQKGRNYYNIGSSESFSVDTTLDIEFATKDYPQFTAAGYTFTRDPKVFTTKTRGSADIGIVIMENIMESMLALQDENKALALELEREKRKNGN